MALGGPGALNTLGFVAYQSGISGGRNSGHKITPTTSPGKRLLQILDIVDLSGLEKKDSQTLDGIDREKPWLLTPREIALLKMLQTEKLENL